MTEEDQDEEQRFLAILRPCVDEPLNGVAVELIVNGRASRYASCRTVMVQILEPRAKRPGRKPHHAPSPKKLNIARAAVLARRDYTHGKEDEAAANRAHEFGVPQSAVYRAAFERKDPDMNALMREVAATPDLINRG